MKKTLFIINFILILSLFSCSNTESINTTISDSLNISQPNESVCLSKDNNELINSSLDNSIAKNILAEDSNDTSSTIETSENYNEPYIPDININQYKMELLDYPQGDEINLSMGLYNWNFNDHIDEKAEKVKEIELFNRTITVEYKNSSTPQFCNIESQLYRRVKGDTIWLNAKTGEVLGAINRQAFNEKDKEIVPEASCREIADKFISDYIDLSKYTNKDVRFDSKYKELDDIDYEYEYVKQINGIDTNEGALVTVTSKGTIQAFVLHNINRYNDVKFNNFNAKDYDNAINYKFTEKAKKEKTNTSQKLIGHKINDSTLVMLNEEKYAMKYSVTVEYEKQTEEGPFNYSFLIDVIVYI